MKPCRSVFGGASEGSLEAARREVGGATDALMEQHRDALEQCKATIQLAESLIQEHEARYRAALAQPNETAMMSFSERMSNQVARSVGNRLIGAAAVSAREQRERMDIAMSAFGQGVEAATERGEVMATRMERLFARSVRRVLLAGGAVLCLLLVSGELVDWWRECHLTGANCRTVQMRQADGRP